MFNNKPVPVNKGDQLFTFKTIVMMMENYFQAITAMLFIIIVVAIAVYFKIYADSTKRTRLMQAQIDLLAQIASAQGVSRDKIADIVATEKVGTK